MTSRGRFAIGAVVVTIGVALLTTLGPTDRRAPRHPPRRVARTLSSLPAPRTDAQPTGPAREHDVARRFARAYLRWQLGHRDPRTRRALRAASTPAIWQAVARQRARPVTLPGPAPRVGPVLVAGSRAAVLLAGHGHRLLSTLRLGRYGGRVRVTAISH